MISGKNIIAKYGQQYPEEIKKLKLVVQYFKDGKTVHNDHNGGTEKLDTQNRCILFNMCKDDSWCCIADNPLLLKNYTYHCRNSLYWVFDVLHLSTAAKSLQLNQDDLILLCDNDYIEKRSNYDEMCFLDSTIVLITKDMYDWVLSL